MKTIINTLSPAMPLGEKLELNFSSMSITLEKVSSTDLSGKRLAQTTGTDVRFPYSQIQQLNHSVMINVSPSVFRSWVFESRLLSACSWSPFRSRQRSHYHCIKLTALRYRSRIQQIHLIFEYRGKRICSCPRWFVRTSLRQRIDRRLCTIQSI